MTSSHYDTGSPFVPPSSAAVMCHLFLPAERGSLGRDVQLAHGVTVDVRCICILPNVNRMSLVAFPAQGS